MMEEFKMINKLAARELLEIKAVSITDENNLFTWVSGIKSPIYCDNRLIISYPRVRDFIADSFARLIEEHAGEFDVVAGTATAGIPHAAWVASKLNKPMVYVRSEAKGHGKGNQIEGRLAEGQRVVLIEDLLSTGGSSLKAVEAIKAAGGEIKHVFAIFSYNFTDLGAKFEAAGVDFHTITDYKTLLGEAVEMGLVEASKLDLLTQWSSNPRMFTKE
jgi:orotate phosphoribosyltransferase